MRILFSLFILFSFFHASGQVVNTNVPRRTDGRNIVQDRSLWADRIFIIPRYSTSPSLNGGVDTVGYIGFNSSDTTLNVRGTGAWFPFPSKAWVLSQVGTPSLSVYTTSSFLTGNRLVGGRNNLYGLTIDSLSYLFQATRSPTSDTSSQVSIVPGQTEVGSYRTTGSRSSVVKTSVLPGNYAISIFNATPTGIYIDSANNIGLGGIAPTNKVHITGSLRIQDGNPGIDKEWIDTTGTGVGAWRTKHASPGTPTFTPVGSIDNFLGTGYSFTITGDGDRMQVTLVTGTGIISTGTIGHINFTAFPSTPISVWSPANVSASIGGTGVGFNATSSSDIIMFNSTAFAASTTYIWNISTGL